jgi:PAS domain-containing protein
MGADHWSVLEAFNEPLYTVDADGRIRSCDPDLEQLTGCAADALLGHPSLDLLGGPCRLIQPRYPALASYGMISASARRPSSDRDRPAQQR